MSFYKKLRFEKLQLWCLAFSITITFFGVIGTRPVARNGQTQNKLERWQQM
jgi:hypothetical protein